MLYNTVRLYVLNGDVLSSIIHSVRTRFSCLLTYGVYSLSAASIDLQRDTAIIVQLRRQTLLKVHIHAVVYTKRHTTL